jgi:hypothetical protein
VRDFQVAAALSGCSYIRKGEERKQERLKPKTRNPEPRKLNPLVLALKISAEIPGYTVLGLTTGAI